MLTNINLCVLIIAVPTKGGEMYKLDKIADFIAEGFLAALEKAVEGTGEYDKARFFEELEKDARAEGRKEAAERWAGISSAFRQIGLRLS